MTDAMTPEHAALVERLGNEACRNGGQGSYAWTARELCGKAAQAIRDLAAENARLDYLLTKESERLDKLTGEYLAANLENARLKALGDGLAEALKATTRAANLALFVIRKQGVMPNSSWQSGFEKDMEAGPPALAAWEKNP